MTSKPIAISLTLLLAAALLLPAETRSSGASLAGRTGTAPPQAGLLDVGGGTIQALLNGADAVAVYGASPAPVRDGDLAEWEPFPMLVLDRYTGAAAIGAAPAPFDNMAVVRLAWDSAALYLAAYVRDDAVVSDSPEPTGDDALVLGVDGNADGQGGGPGDFRLVVAADGRVVGPSGAQAVTKRVPDGYYVEVRLPAATFGPPGLAAERCFAFNWGLLDDDDGGAVDGELRWHGLPLDPPQAGWPLAALSAEVRTPTGLAEAGRWEWAGGGAFKDIFFVDDRYGWAAGTGVWRTTDGGATWTHLPVFAEETLEDVVFVDRNHGWVRTADSHVYRTADGGLTWSHVLSMFDRFAAAVPDALQAIGPDDLWFAGVQVYPSYESAVKFYHGRNGGFSGAPGGDVSREADTVLYSDPDGYVEPVGMQFRDVQHGWLAANIGGYDYPEGEWGPVGVLAMTTDEGATWREITLGTSPKDGPSFAGMAFGSATHGWLTGGTKGAREHVWRTTDGGLTWTEQATPAAAPGWVQALDANSAYLADGARLLRTTDGGVSWSVRAASAPALMRFRTLSEGWGVTGATIYKTIDGGATWQTVFALPASQPAWYWDPLHGWRRDGGELLGTTDGGVTWRRLATGLPAVDTFQFVGPADGWAWHLASQGLAHTTDGGATWQRQTTGSDSLATLQFGDAWHGWVRALNGRVLRTTDGGTTWRPSTPPPSPVDMWCANWRPDTCEVSIVGWQWHNADDGRVFWHGWRWGMGLHGESAHFQTRTGDGGDTWGSFEGKPQSAQFVDENVGFGWHIESPDTSHYLDGWYSGLRTLDGGATWSEIYNGGIYWFRGYLREALRAADAERVWASWHMSGYTGWQPSEIQFSSDGGSAWTNQRTEVELAAPSFDHVGEALATGSSGSLHRYRNTEIAARRAARPPAIDGDITDWFGVAIYPLKAENAWRIERTRPAPLDSSAILQAAWDDATLYFAVRVYDDVIVTDDPAAPWRDDSLELAFDGRHDHVRNASHDDDRQFTITAAGATFESGSPTTCYRAAAGRWEQGYTVEVALPRACLGEIPIAEGQIVGFNWSLADDDDDGNADSRLFWLGRGTYSADAEWGQLRDSALIAAMPPPGSTDTPTPTATHTATLTPTPTGTPTATGTLTGTLTGTPTGTPTVTPTATAIVTGTVTPSPAPQRVYLPVILR